MGNFSGLTQRRGLFSLGGRNGLLASIVLGLMWSAQLVAMEAPAGGAFDPRPLTQKAEKALKKDKFTFAVLGDCYAKGAFPELLKMVEKKKPAFVLTVGDMVSRGSGGKAPTNWKLLEKVGGAFFRKIPTWPVIGNHEVMGGSQAEGRKNNRTFYGLEEDRFSFTFRNCKFIFLDWKGEPAHRTHVEFAEKELKSAKGKYAHTFIVRHMPFYTVGKKRPSEIPNKPTALTAVLKKYNVTATFAGHDHSYYRTQREGVTHIISGVAGGGWAEINPLKRVKDAIKGDSYMGHVRDDGERGDIVLHMAGKKEKIVKPPKQKNPEGAFAFAVFIDVNGKNVTGRVVCIDGTVWETFTIKGKKNKKTRGR